MNTFHYDMTILLVNYTFFTCINTPFDTEHHREHNKSDNLKNVGLPYELHYTHYMYTVLLNHKQCRTVLHYHKNCQHLDKNIVHYMCSAQNWCCICSLHRHCDSLQEELVGLRLSSHSPDKPPNVRQQDQGLRTKVTRDLHRKGGKVVDGAEVRVLSPLLIIENS